MNGHQNCKTNYQWNFKFSGENICIYSLCPLHVCPCGLYRAAVESTHLLIWKTVGLTPLHPLSLLTLTLIYGVSAWRRTVERDTTRRSSPVWGQRLIEWPFSLSQLPWHGVALLGTAQRRVRPRSHQRFRKDAYGRALTEGAEWENFIWLLFG